MNIKNIIFPVSIYYPQTFKTDKVVFSNMLGKPFVFVFYPKDFSLVCTKQICDYSQGLSFSSFTKDIPVQIFASSKDTIETHKKFAKQFHITVPLIADTDGKLAKYFSVQGPIFNISNRRAVFLVGKNGNVVWKKIEKSIVFRTKSSKIRQMVSQYLLE